MGPVCAYDTLVIEMIAKPVLPIWFSDTVCKRRESVRVWIDAKMGVDLTAHRKSIKDKIN